MLFTLVSLVFSAFYKFRAYHGFTHFQDNRNIAIPGTSVFSSGSLCRWIKDELVAHPCEQIESACNLPLQQFSFCERMQVMAAAKVVPEYTLSDAEQTCVYTHHASINRACTQLIILLGLFPFQISALHMFFYGIYVFVFFFAYGSKVGKRKGCICNCLLFPLYYVQLVFNTVV